MKRTCDILHRRDQIRGLIF